MTDWTYHVKISTEEGSGITDAFEDLKNTQEKTRSQFESITQFFQSTDFTKSLLDTLKESLKDLGNEETKESIVPILEGMMEIKAGILTLMELKEGNVDTVLDTFRKMSENIGEEGILTGLNNLLAQDEEKAAAREARENKYLELMMEYQLKSPVFSNLKPESILTPDITGTIPYQNRLPDERELSSTTDFMKKYTRSLAEVGAADFFKYLTKTSTTSGVDIFRQLLEGGEKNPAYDAITGLLSNLAEINTQIRAYTIDEGDIDTEQKQTPEWKFNKAILEEQRTNLQDEIGKSKYFKNLKAEFIKGFVKQLDTASIFNDKDNVGLLNIIVDEMFKNLEHAVMQPAFAGVNKNSEGVARPLIPFLEGRKELLSRKNIASDIDKLIENENFLNLKTLRDKLQTLLTQSHEEGIAENPDSPITSVIQKLKDNLNKEDASAIVAETLSEFLKTVLEGDLLGLRNELIAAGSPTNVTRQNEETRIARDAKVNDSLLRLIEILEKTPTEIGNDTEELSYDKFFEDALADSDVKTNVLLHAINLNGDQIESAINLSHNKTVARIRMLQDAVNQIQNTPETAATTGDFYPAM